jgi:hypothetical protein
MVIIYIKIFNSKTIQNLPKLGFFGLKTNHLATLVLTKGQTLTTGAIMSPKGEFLGVNEGVNIPPRGKISPWGQR